MAISDDAAAIAASNLVLAHIQSSNDKKGSIPHLFAEYQRVVRDGTVEQIQPRKRVSGKGDQQG